MRRIYWKSDFDVEVRLRDKDGREIELPDCDWSAKYWTTNKENAYEASYQDGICHNCKRDKDGRFRVIFNDHRLEAGTLKWEPHFELRNTLYPGGVQDVILPQQLDVELVNERVDNPFEERVKERDSREAMEIMVEDYSKSPLMKLLMVSRQREVKNPEVKYYEEEVRKNNSVRVAADLPGGMMMATLPISESERDLIERGMTLLIPDVDGYTPDGDDLVSGSPLMLYVTKIDKESGNPVVKAVNGIKDTPSDKQCKVPGILAGSEVVIIGRSIGQGEDLTAIVGEEPEESRMVYCQKRTLGSEVQAFLERRRKGEEPENPGSAERAVKAFVEESARTAWSGQPGKLPVELANGQEDQVLCSEGIRWQIYREITESEWTLEKIAVMVRLFFYRDDSPSRGLLLCGSGLMTKLTNLDWNGSAVMSMTMERQPDGERKLVLRTVFGDIEIKQDGTLDRLCWANSGGLIDAEKLERYVYKGSEQAGGPLEICDAPVLKAGSHIWLNGDRIEEYMAADVDFFIRFWDQATLPEAESGVVYYLLSDCPAIGAGAKAGQLWTLGGVDDDQWMKWREDGSIWRG